MSDYVQQNCIVSSFQISDSWVILSPIEASIKRKIEAVGTPLKDWDISINYGIKTGLNEAFIISTEKRNEILANCADEDERRRTEELIRPILRGRDIKRYSYDWAGLWLIATFPSKQYMIEDFPSVRNYLLSFAASILEENHNYEILHSCLEEYCYKKLSQTGEPIKINGKRVLDKNGKIEKSRKKTNNKWFELQDSINYWDDFSRPKIVWKRVGSILRFAYDDQGCYVLDSTCFATGSNVKFLTGFLNSKLGNYMLQDAPKTGTGDLLISVQAVEPIRVPIPQEKTSDEIVGIVDHINSKGMQELLNKKIYDLYGLSLEERAYIESKQM